jgi:PAS domain S-box-containing protein
VDNRDDMIRDEGAPFADIAEALGLGMAFRIRADADGTFRFTYVSPNCEALNGVPAEAVLADPSALYGLIVPERWAEYARAERAALAGDGRLDVEVQMRLPTGELRWRRNAAVRRQLPDGSSLWDGLMSEITEAKLAADQLEAQKRNLEIAVEATRLGFWEWRVGTGEIVWSERNKAIFGLPPDAPVTVQMYLAMIHPDDRERCLAAFRAAQESPDGADFAMEYRAVAPNGQLRWIITRGRVVVDGNERRVVGTTLDNTDRHEAEERRSLVMGELAHRAKNGLQVMMAIISETARTADSVESLETVLTARLNAMAQAQDLVSAAGGRPVQLADLAERALTPFGLARFELQPQIAGLTVHGDVAGGLALLLHEMATNAVKYGALSRPEGRVSLSAEGAGPGMAALSWRERGGPRVEPSNRRGFGSRVLQAALRQQGGKVEPAFEPDGFSARMEFRVAG